MGYEGMGGGGGVGVWGCGGVLCFLCLLHSIRLGLLRGTQTSRWYMDFNFLRLLMLSYDTLDVFQMGYLKIQIDDKFYIFDVK